MGEKLQVKGESLEFVFNLLELQNGKNAVHLQNLLLIFPNGLTKVQELIVSCSPVLLQKIFLVPLGSSMLCLVSLWYIVFST